MSTPQQRIEQLLIDLKADGRSSPNDWHRFYLLLKSKKRFGQKDPPVSLILAASGESHANKHRRLSEQLYWAHENSCLDDVICYLKDIPPEEWNWCPRDKWFQDTYPS